MRMMVAFEKGDALRCVGHLDLMRTMQRALRRSGLPVRYSNGFNPHIRLSFAAPLSVGVAGLRELMEVPVEDGLTTEEFTTRMNAVLPPALQVRGCWAVGDDFPSLMSLVAGSDYRIEMPSCAEADQAAEAFERFMALPEYVANRRTKSGENPCDIRPFVLDGACERTGDGWRVTLRTAVTAQGALKPSLWLKCLREFAGAGEFSHSIFRAAILAKTPDGGLAPMEERFHG